MTNQPKISIITPTYNSSKTIEDCLNSTTAQNYDYLEHVIIDGISKDGTVDIIKNYAKKFNYIKFISEEDNGIYDAMNKGIDLASGDYLIFLGADDKLTNNIIKSLISKVNFYDYDLVYGKVQYPTYSCGKLFDVNTLSENMLKDQFIHRYMHHQGTFIKKNLFSKFGKYNLKYEIGADVYFFIKTINHAEVKKIFIEETISTLGDDGLSAHKEELNLRYDFPKLAKKHLNIKINNKEYYRNLAKYYFNDIREKRTIKGLKGILKIMINKGDIIYYLKNTLYWLKNR